MRRRIRPQPSERVLIRWPVVLLIGLPLIILNCGWIAHSEIRTYVTEITISALLMGVVFLLFVLTLANLAVRRVSGRRIALTQPELMALYSMLSLSSVVAGVGHFGFFTPFLASVFYKDNATFAAYQSFTPLLPAFQGPRDMAVLRDFWLGHSTFFASATLRAWAMPLTVWTVFFLILLWTTLCLGLIFRHRWSEEERLPFPIIELPLQMTAESGAALYRQPLLWAGFVIPAFLHSLNSLQSLYPALPSLKINTLHDLAWDGVLVYPWTGIDSFNILVHPCGVGLGFLIHTDVSFSLWFFYLAKIAAKVLGVALGIRDPAQGWRGDAAAQFPYTGFQCWGAWLTLGGMSLWSARHYLVDYGRRAFGKYSGQRREDEPLSPRANLVGFTLGFLALCCFVWSWSGERPWIPVIFFVFYLLLMTALSRIRAETAVVATELEWMTPQGMITAFVGTHNLSQTDLVHIGMLGWFNSDYRAAGMPHQLEGVVGVLRSAQGETAPVRANLRPLVPVMMLSALVAMVAALLWDLQLYYTLGASVGVINQWRPWKGAEPWRNIYEWINNPKPPNLTGLLWAVIGGLITVGLTALRHRFVGFPLHPAAYVMNMSLANDQFWMDMLIAWTLKSLIMRYAGMRGYRRTRPFFLGLILGDFVTGAAWSILGALLDVELFRTFAI